MHIVLIEPDVLQARAYMGALERAGHTLTHATAAQQAVQLADACTPDVVILELQLSSHNGVEFLYEFRSYPEWLRVPIILHTFVPLHELVRVPILQKELGVKAILYKPTTTLSVLCTTVQDVALVVS
jgi:DNA-binding response OmpR family regulator